MGRNAYFYSAAPRYAARMPSSAHGARAQRASPSFHSPQDPNCDEDDRGTTMGGRSLGSSAQTPLPAASRPPPAAAAPEATVYVVYSPQGSRPLSGVHSESLVGRMGARAKSTVAGRQRGVAGGGAYCAYDSSTGSQLLCIPQNTSTSFFPDRDSGPPSTQKGHVSSLRVNEDVPRVASNGLPLSAPQRVLVIQLCPYCLPSSGLPSVLSLELTVRDRVGQRRLLFSSVARRVQAHVQHTKVPFGGVLQQAEVNSGRGRWVNLFLDIGSLHQVCFNGGPISGENSGASRSISPARRGYRLKQVKLSCTGGVGVRVRRVLAMHAMPSVGDDRAGDLTTNTGSGASSFPLPESLRLPAGVEFLSLFIRTGRETVLLGEREAQPSEKDSQSQAKGHRQPASPPSTGTRPLIRGRAQQQQQQRQQHHDNRRDSPSFVEVSALTERDSAESEPGERERGTPPPRRTRGVQEGRGRPQHERRTGTPPRPDPPRFMQHQERVVNAPPAPTATAATPPAKGSSWRSTEWQPALNRLQANLRKAVPLSLLHANVVPAHRKGQGRMDSRGKEEEGMVRSGSSSPPLSEDEAAGEATHVTAEPSLAPPASEDAESFIVQEMSNDTSNVGPRSLASQRAQPSTLVSPVKSRGSHGGGCAGSDAAVSDNEEQYGAAEALMELMAQRVRCIQSVLRDVQAMRSLPPSPRVSRRPAAGLSASSPPRPLTTPVSRKGESSSPTRMAPAPAAAHVEAEEADDDAIDFAALELWRSTEEPLPTTARRHRETRKEKGSGPDGSSGSTRDTDGEEEESSSPVRSRPRRHRRRRGGQGTGEDPSPASAPMPHAVDRLVLVDSVPRLSTVGTAPAEQVPFHPQFLAEAPEGLQAQMRAAKRLSYGSTMGSSSSLLRQLQHQRQDGTSSPTSVPPGSSLDDCSRGEAEERDLNTATYRTTGRGATGSTAANQQSLTSAQTSWTFHSSPLVPSSLAVGHGGSVVSQLDSWEKDQHQPFPHSDEHVLHGSRCGEDRGSGSGSGDRGPDEAPPPPPPPPPRPLSWAQGWRPGRLGEAGAQGNANYASVGSASTAASGLPPQAPTSHRNPRENNTPAPATFLGSATAAIPYSPHSGRTPPPQQPQAPPLPQPSRDDVVRGTTPMGHGSVGASDPLGLPPAPTPSSAGLRTPIQQQRRQQYGQREEPPTVPVAQEQASPASPAEAVVRRAPGVRLSRSSDKVQHEEPNHSSGDEDEDDSDGFFLVSPEELATVLAAQQQRPPRYPPSTLSTVNTSTATTALTPTSSFSAHVERLGRIPLYCQEPQEVVAVPASSRGSMASLSQGAPSSAAPRRRRQREERHHRQRVLAVDSQRFLYDPVLGCYLDLKTNAFVDPGDSIASLA